MDKYIFDESNGLWYELQGDYYIPCLILSEEDAQPIGLCSFSNPNASAISRFVFPASFISRISFSKSLMCVYFLLDIMTPLDVLLLSYIKGCFVYCPFLLVQFSSRVRRFVSLLADAETDSRSFAGIPLLTLRQFDRQILAWMSFMLI